MRNDSFESGSHWLTRIVAILILVLGSSLLGMPSIADEPEAPQTRLGVHTSGPSIGTRLATIMVSIDYNNANVAEAFEALSLKSKAADPDGAGVEFIVEADALDTAKHVSLNLHNVSVGEAMENICKLACVKPKLESDGVHLVSMHASLDAMEMPAIDQSESHRLVVHKLQNIVMDKVNLKNLDIAKVIQFLAIRTKALDPDKEGVNFVLGNIAPTDNIQRQVTINVSNIPLADLLNLIAQQTGLRYLVEDGAVYFKP